MYLFSDYRGKIVMKKSAILFGINEYHDCPLQNAVNDATVLSEKLSQLGFDAECCLNVSRESMDRSLLAFRSKLEQSSVGLFFFAGHGIQCKGENFLATKDTNFVDEISCRHTSFPLNDVIDIFEESKVTTKIFILDACRNNPFVTWRSAANDGLGGFIAANFCAFPAVFISIAAGVAVDGFFYVLKDRFLKAYRKKGKT